MGHQETEKALRYISQLNDARCNDRWQDVPELARKVEKHAPHRKCLTITARAEERVATFSQQRPSTASSTSSRNLSSIIPTLLTIIEEEGTTYAQDAFQATICLGWLHATLDEPGLAVARFPKDFGAAVSNLASSAQVLSNWTEVCIVKGAYLKGSCQEKTASAGDALNTYSSVLDYLSHFPSLAPKSSQFRRWTERLLSRLCLLSEQSLSTSPLVDANTALGAFRMWAKFWDGTSPQAISSTSSETSNVRRSVWKAYYDNLSALLHQNLRYTPSSTNHDVQLLEPSGKLGHEDHLTSRLRQHAELKRVETIYEGLLLKETRFPKASESNPEIEDWIDSVISNWRVLCGPSWSDEELGEGGKNAVGRNVLDILYRAAMKTFHSAQIYRYLFILHVSVGEFDLAFKAFDSYVEIVTRGKDRTEKSGEVDEGLDDDDMVLRTAAEAVRILCRFGAHKEAEKAKELGEKIEHFLKQHTPTGSHLSPSENDDRPETPREAVVLPRTLAVAYRAIGISKAHWARVTFDASSRTDFQQQAIQALRSAIDPKLQDPNNLEALYALGLVLAETRDIPGAIKIVKRALSSVSVQPMTADGAISEDSPQAAIPIGNYTRERKLIPLWHLLGLLLTARQDYATAAKSCEAAFEQFPSTRVLFGSGEEEKEYRSEHLNTLSVPHVGEKPIKRSSQGLVDRMEPYEKEEIVQIKMTQLVLIEYMDGAHAAVDASDELLALYARLFGDPDAGRAKLPAPTTPVAPPRSSIGTIKGSIFGRPRTSRNSLDKASAAPTSVSMGTSRPSTMMTQHTVAPTIQVTDEDAVPDSANGHSHHLHLPFHHKEHAEQQHSRHRSGSVKLQKKSAGSLRRRTQDPSSNFQVADGGTEDRGAEIDKSGLSRKASAASRKSQRQPMSNSLHKTDSPDQPLGPIAHNMPSQVEPPPAGHKKQPPKQDIRLPAPFPGFDQAGPEPRFTVLQERRHKVSLLVSIWLFTSRLYTAAAMYEDAKGALDEAFRLVGDLELEVAQELSSSKGFTERGWGGGKSIEELWGDVWAARGELAQTQSSPHGALSLFEKALARFPDHPVAVIGISNILLDIYCKVIPPEASQEPGIIPASIPPAVPSISVPDMEKARQHVHSLAPSAQNIVTPSELNRLAARDRAYGLLSTLTKLGTGWDNTEAWYTLARAYEESGEVEKQKQVLWWVVELEDARPLRHWTNVGVGGFVL